MDLSLSNLMKYSTGRPGSPVAGDISSKRFSQSAYSPRTSDRHSVDERFKDYQAGGYGRENLGRSYQNLGYDHQRLNQNLERDYQAERQNLGLSSQNMEQTLQNLRQNYQSEALRKQVLEKEHKKSGQKYQIDGHGVDGHKYYTEGHGVEGHKYKMNVHGIDGHKYKIDGRSVEGQKYYSDGLGIDGKKQQSSDENLQKLKQNYDIEGYSQQALEQSYKNLQLLRQSTGHKLGEEYESDDHTYQRDGYGHTDLDLRSTRKSRYSSREHMQDLDTFSRQRTTKKGSLVANLSGTRYDAINQVVDQRGFNITKGDVSTANLIWNDSFVSTERIAELKPFQRINHFPGMGEITRKDCLAKNIKKVQETHREDFSFIPETWLPSEHSLLLSHAKELKAKKKQKTFIVKPSNRAQGHGIELYTNAEKIQAAENFIVQEYIDRPFLLDRYKFDLRLYVLITSCDPLRVYLFKDGLVRMSTEKYRTPDEDNLSHKFMHLTNYSVNKHNQDYQKGTSTDSGSKRSVQYFLKYVAEKTDHNVGQLWRNITDIIVKTLMIGLPQMYTSYKLCRPGSKMGNDSVCFEILGFDFLLDWNLSPWLIEVNRSPSFGIDERIDGQIKPTLIDDTVKLLNIKASDKDKSMRALKGQSERRLHSSTKRTDDYSKRKDDLNELLQQIRNLTLREEFEDKHCGHFQRIFPVEDKTRQDRFVKLMLSVTNILMPDRASTLQREFKRMYSNRPKEDDILEMMAQCEIDAKNGKQYKRGQKDEDDDIKDGVMSSHKTKSKDKTSGSLQGLNSGGKESSNYVSPVDEDNLARKTLLALNKAKVKFPGKTEKESEHFLDKIHENWKMHKQRIGTYWLVKLDSTKREKVIDIVRSTVRAVIQPIWPNDIDSLPLYRTFNKIFMRMLSNHGQGLWNCFSSNKSSSSWEAIVSKSSRVVTDVELICCRRVVQLCQDCLVIVYQFTTDTEAQTI